jgi:hypothetical protein
MNDNSGSSCRDSDQDQDQDMKDYSRAELIEREDEQLEKASGEADVNNKNEQRQDNHSLSVCKDKEQEASLKAHSNHQSDIKESSKVVIKEEQDDDYISVDVELNEGPGGNLSQGESCSNNNEQPKDLSGKQQQHQRGESDGVKDDDDDHDREEGIINATQEGSGGRSRKEIVGGSNSASGGRQAVESTEGGGGGCGETGSNHSTSTSLSPRSSPGMSPSHPYDFSGAPSMVSRFHPFFDHPFMAYRHFNSFNFGGAFPGSNGPDGSNNNNNSPASAYESALNMIGRKGMLPPGKPSPGIEAFHEFQNGVVSLVPSRGANGPLGSGGGGNEHLSRLRGEDMFSPRGASSAELISSIINSNRGDLGLSPLNLGNHHSNPNSLAMDERRKRNRTFIDPVTEVPRLEQWFTLNTHPSHNLILKYTDELNRMPYRQKFPKLEPKNVQFWFKNRRAKCKRLKMTL